MLKSKLFPSLSLYLLFVKKSKKVILFFAYTNSVLFLDFYALRFFKLFTFLELSNMSRRLLSIARVPQFQRSFTGASGQLPPRADIDVVPPLTQLSEDELAFKETGKH